MAFRIYCNNCFEIIWPPFYILAKRTFCSEYCAEKKKDSYSSTHTERGIQKNKWIRAPKARVKDRGCQIRTDSYYRKKQHKTVLHPTHDSPLSKNILISPVVVRPYVFPRPWCYVFFPGFCVEARYIVAIFYRVDQLSTTSLGPHEWIWSAYAQIKFERGRTPFFIFNPRSGNARIKHQ